MICETTTLLAHPGTQYALHLARELNERGSLGGFHTCLAVSAESNLVRIMTPLASVLGVERQWQNRLLHGVPPSKLHCYPGLEINSWWRIRQRQPITAVLRKRNDAFQTQISARALDHAEVVIGFDTSAKILARRTQAQGKRFLLDRSIGHPRSYDIIVKQLRERFPGWEDTVETKTAADLELEDAEHELAHLIVVPSQFVADTLTSNGVPSSKIRINPFGTDVESFRPAVDRPPNRPLTFLFVGALTARKGLPLLLEAWQQLAPGNAKLVVAGTGTVPNHVVRRLPQSVRLMPAVARQRLPQLFQSADVFVFPSFFEGLAQVQLEAAASGLPVVGTTASGAAEIVTEGETGFIVEAGNLEQLIDRLQRFIDEPSLAKQMSERVKLKRASLSWSAYGERWRQTLQDLG